MIEEVRIVRRDIDLLEAQTMGTSDSRGGQPAVFVDVLLSDGSRGKGEALPWPYFGGETREGAFDALSTQLAPSVIGRDESEWRVLRRSLDDVMPHNSLAKCALEMAIVDAFCRSRSISLRSLVGGASVRTRLSYSLSLQELEAEADVLARKSAEGYDIIKVKVGVKEPGVDVRRIEQVAAMLPGSRIRVDCNTNATDDLLRALDAVHQRIPIEFCEQPFAVDQDGRLCRLRRWFSIPISLDESIRCAQDVARVSNIGLADMVSLKLGKLGGITNALEAISTASRLGMPVYTGAMSETPLSMATFLSVMSIARNVVPGSDYYYPYDIVDVIDIEGGVRREGALLSLRDLPGHGSSIPDAWFDEATVVRA